MSHVLKLFHYAIQFSRESFENVVGDAGNIPGDPFYFIFDKISVIFGQIMSAGGTESRI